MYHHPSSVMKHDVKTPRYTSHEAPESTFIHERHRLQGSSLFPLLSDCSETSAYPAGTVGKRIIVTFVAIRMRKLRSLLVE